MKKFKKWLLTCDYNRVEATQNFGFAFSMAWLTIGFFAQFVTSTLPLIISIVFLAISLVILLLGMIWSEFIEKYEGVWE